MGTIDLRIRDIVSYYGSIFIIFLILAWLATILWRRFQKNFYRSYLLGFETECADLAVTYKKILFQQLSHIKSHDEILKSLNRIRILEIGVKTGENIQFYPDRSHFIGVDWNKKLADYLTGSDRSWQFSHIYFERLIIGDGSSLSVIPSDCVDVVVTTRSLCSARSVQHTLLEIRRILAPNGKYLFLEHVQDPPGTSIQRLQKILTRTKIWPSIFENCHLDNDPIFFIKKTGFRNLTWKSFILEGHISQPSLLFLTRNHVIGTATK